MKLVLTIFLTVIALVATAARGENSNENNTLADLEFENDISDEKVLNKTISIQGRGLILSANRRKALENFINHLPCGWPESGVPPLAPYAKREIDFELKTSFMELSQKFEYFRIDGLNIALIDRLKVTALTKRVRFDLTFPRIFISGKYLTDILIDTMEKYKMSIQFNGEGDLDVMLEDLNLRGTFKYNMPLFFGHTTISKLDAVISLGNVVSNITGIGGSGKFNEYFNRKVEELILYAVNSNQDEISKKLKEDLVPIINANLEGHNLRTFFKSLFGNKGKICYPPPLPWESDDN